LICSCDKNPLDETVVTVTPAELGSEGISFLQLAVRNIKPSRIIVKRM